ncbi:conserved hypothetical protein [Pyrobaculum islandicum DSM 4184]|uniref:Uncharacterized protein n=1 Tax=Pyrobaculum islandicum (strain DSM 4184 / JCM 9189 / GEO3) TaxID=384616 RepID=A1RUN6_PYRIL|nr:hypothetical protein [Pyrobaculum islandicum]ABL88668.1 conserved hypothetical protein [Pyrobaculum islandicum DSM 4184]
MRYKIGLLLDERRYEAVKGLPLAEKLRSLFGGELKILELEVDEEVAKRILAEFPSARVDARGYLEDLPVAFKRALFEALVARGSPAEALAEVFRRIEEVKEAASRESDYLPPP